MAVRREALYDEVWAEPMLAVAKRHGVSSSFLARVCARLNVPRPPRGYWAKRAFGHTPCRPLLPDARPGDEAEWRRPGEPPSDETVAPDVHQVPPVAPAPSPVRPRSRHRLLAQARHHFEVDRHSEDGRIRPWKKVLVDLYVSPTALGRALRTASAVFLALEARGHHVVIAAHGEGFRRPQVDPATDRFSYNREWEPMRPTVVFVGNLAIGLTLFEETECVPCRLVEGRWVRAPNVPESQVDTWRPGQPYVSKRTVAVGRLCLRAFCPYPVAAWERRWHEASRGDLLDRAATVAEEIESEAPSLVQLVEEGRREAVRRQREAQIEHEKWQREEAERQRAANVKASREELLDAIDAWGEARRIEAFFDEASRGATTLPDAERAEIDDRLRLAREMIGPIDALASLRDWIAPNER